MVQDFYEIDRETIGKSLAFTLTMDKISAGLLGAYQSSDQVIAFNNNVLSEVTNFYLRPGIALKENQKDKFQKDYQKWYLEKEIGKEFPSGEPRLKNNLNKKKKLKKLMSLKFESRKLQNIILCQDIRLMVRHTIFLMKRLIVF